MSPGPPIKFDVSAKAEFSARVPDESTGRLIDSLTDLIRPLSEYFGLRADRIRLQREDVVFEITQKAVRRIQLENITVNPLPTKFLVPFLENSSLEGDDEKLKDMWSSLLVNASRRTDSDSFMALNFLGELTSEGAKFLELLIQSSYVLSFSDYASYRREHHANALKCLHKIENICKAKGSATRTTDLGEVDDLAKVILLKIGYLPDSIPKGERGFGIRAIDSEVHQLEFLKSRGIIEENTSHSEFLSSHFINLTYLNFTQLGRRLIMKFR